MNLHIVRHVEGGRLLAGVVLRMSLEFEQAMLRAEEIDAIPVLELESLRVSTDGHAANRIPGHMNTSFQHCHRRAAAPDAISA